MKKTTPATVLVELVFFGGGEEKEAVSRIRGYFGMWV